MKTSILIGLTLAGFLTGPAFAQDKMSDASSMSGNGIAMSNHATIKLHVVKINPADLMASKLIGMNVYNNTNESVGEVKDLVMKDGKTIAGVVVNVGGFLGMGESYVLVDPSSIAVSDKDGTMTCDRLRRRRAIRKAGGAEASRGADTTGGCAPGCSQTGCTWRSAWH